MINTSYADATSFFPERIIAVVLEGNETAELPKVANTQVVLIALMYGDELVNRFDVIQKVLMGLVSGFWVVFLVVFPVPTRFFLQGVW